MALAHRREPVGVVLLRVVLRADPEEAAVEQPDGAGEHLARAASRPARGPCATRARSCGSAARELDHRVELLGVAPLAPAVVVAVLLAPGGVDAGRLDVAHRVGADPDVLPGRRDGELADPLEHARLADPGARRRPGTRSPCRGAGGGCRGPSSRLAAVCHGRSCARWRRPANLRAPERPGRSRDQLARARGERPRAHLEVERVAARQRHRPAGLLHDQLRRRHVDRPDAAQRDHRVEAPAADQAMSAPPSRARAAASPPIERAPRDAAATRPGRAVSSPRISSGPGSARAAGGRRRRPPRRARPTIALRVQLGDEADLHVGHAQPAGTAIETQRERQAALGVDRAVHRVDHHPAAGPPPPSSTSPRSSDTALSGTPRPRARANTASSAALSTASVVSPPSPRPVSRPPLGRGGQRGDAGRARAPRAGTASSQLASAAGGEEPDRGKQGTGGVS